MVASVDWGRRTLGGRAPSTSTPPPPQGDRNCSSHSPFQKAKRHNTPGRQDDLKGDGNNTKPKKQGHLEKNMRLASRCQREVKSSRKSAWPLQTSLGTFLFLLRPRLPVGSPPPQTHGLLLSWVCVPSPGLLKSKIPSALVFRELHTLSGGEAGWPARTEKWFGNKALPHPPSEPPQPCIPPRARAPARKSDFKGPVPSV